VELWRFEVEGVRLHPNFQRPLAAKLCLRLEMCGNGLQHSQSLPFPSVRSSSHDAYDLIPIPVPLPNFLPIPSHSHSRLTNEQHLSLNNQTMISTELYGRVSQGTNVAVFYWLAFASSQPMGILAHIKK